MLLGHGEEATYHLSTSLPLIILSVPGSLFLLPSSLRNCDSRPSGHFYEPPMASLAHLLHSHSLSQRSPSRRRYCAAAPGSSVYQCPSLGDPRTGAEAELETCEYLPGLARASDTDGLAVRCCRTVQLATCRDISSLCLDAAVDAGSSVYGDLRQRS